MAHIGVRELRSALAVYLRRAQHGERIVVTVDGSPVAQLASLSGDHSGVSLADLVARGSVQPPRRRGDWVPAEPLALTSGSRVDRAISQVRS